MNRTPKEKPLRVYLRVSQSDKQKIESLAESCGLSASEYLRQRALGFMPKAALPDAFYDFYAKLCDLCNSEIGKTSYEAEKQLLDLIDEIHTELLLPVKQNREQIKIEVMTSWQQQDSGRSKTG